nr:LPS-assembly protein LptD [Saprospiraceae bacterium]
MTCTGINAFAQTIDTLSDQDSGQLYGEIALSADGPDDVIHYLSRDSAFFENKTRIFYLFGAAQIKYQELVLEADFISIDLNQNVATALAYPNEDGEMEGFPVFKEGNQTYFAEEIRYNFLTRKGRVDGAFTRQGDLNIHGERTKFIGTEDSEEASNFVVYQRNAIFTTCDHPEPHFGIRSSKQKVIPGKLAVIGPSNLEIAGVPTPLWLPFGFFPLVQSKRAGVIFPNDFEYSPRWGYGLRDVGYYLPINDYLDAEILGSIYMRGSWSLGSNVRYNRRYKYNGSLNLSYSVFKEEARESTDIETNRSFRISLRHNQAQNAHPTRTFGGSINIETNQFRSLNYNDYDNVFNNQLSSNFSFTQLFPDKPYRLTATFSHNQNTQTRRMDITFPSLNFQMNQIFPFKRHGQPGPEQWYEKISFRYNASYQNRFSSPDSLFMSPEFFESSKMGLRQSASSNAVFRVARYFNFTPSIDYSEVWYVNSLEREFREELDIRTDTIFNADSTEFFIERDTLGYGELVDRDRRGFTSYRTIRGALNLNTQIFGTARFSKGFLRGIRHVVKPNIGLSYSPDYTRESLGYFEQVEVINAKGGRDTVSYSRFQNEIFGGPPSGGSQMLMNYSIGNTLQAKTFSRRDSTVNDIDLISNFNISGNYDFNRDSLNWSMVRMGGTARMLNGLTTLSLGLMYDFYDINEEGRRVDKFYLKEEGKPLRFVNANLRISTSMTIGRLIGMLPFSEEKGSTGGSSVLDLIKNLSINHRIEFSLHPRGVEERLEVRSHFISLRGQVPLSENWNLNITNIDYNFIQNRMTYPDFGISRDLHCWTMQLSWQPRRGTYQFTIGVKPGTLDFLNVPYRKSRVDGFTGF